MAKKNRFLVDEDFDDDIRIDDNDIDDYYVEHTPVNNKRVRKQALLGGIVVFIIIILICGGIGLYRLIDKYTPNNEVMDLYDYYGIDRENDIKKEKAFIRFNDQPADAYAYCFDESWYFTKSFVDDNLNNKFYYDYGNNELIYTTPTKIITIPFDSQTYYVDDTMKKEHYVIAKNIDGEIYISVDFVKDRTDFIYEVRTSPYRMLVRTEYSTVLFTKPADKAVLRTGPGIKNPILSVDEEIVNFKEMGVQGEYTKLESDDGITCYVRTKELGQKKTVTYSNVFQKPIYTSISKPYQINMVWHAVYSLKDNDKIYSFLDNTKGVNVVSPTWYGLTDSKGGFSSFAQKEYVDYIHETGREVWALFSDFESVNPETGFSLFELFSVTENRRALISAMMAEVYEYGYDGINIDFEKIDSATGIHYVQFLRELSIQCRKAGIVLSIDNYVPMPHTAHYDRREQGNVADYVIVMGYDEHYNGGSQAGSVASLSFVKRGIEKTLEEVPPEKVINALPYYTRIWDEYYDEDGNYVLEGKGKGMKTANAWVEEKGFPVNWSEEVGQYVTEGEADGHRYSVWIEDARSIREKMKLISEYNIAGIAGWSLGDECPEIWDVIEEYLN